MKRSAPLSWRPRYGYSDALVNDLCAVADARARVELLPLPADESLRLRHAAYQRSTRSSTRIEGNPLDDQAVRVAIAAAGREGSEAGTGGAQLLACARPCGGMGTGDQPPE